MQFAQTAQGNFFIFDISLIMTDFFMIIKFQLCVPDIPEHQDETPPMIHTES